LDKNNNYDLVIDNQNVINHVDMNRDNNNGDNIFTTIITMYFDDIKRMTNDINGITSKLDCVFLISVILPFTIMFIVLLASEEFKTKVMDYWITQIIYYCLFLVGLPFIFMGCYATCSLTYKFIHLAYHDNI